MGSGGGDWCGVVAIDKPAGVTSRQIVDKVAKIVRPAKAGHAGTLDPLATGVLVIAVGSATRLISYIQQGRKRYVGQFRLGQRSDTDDVNGQVTAGGDASHVTELRLTEAVATFVGAISQVPPQFSAVHVDGQRAYALARKGESFDLQARNVEIHSIRLTWFRPPDFELEIECGSGTYVRSIGRDLGEQFGCGAIMTSLRRLAVGPYLVEDALQPDDLNVERLRQCLQSPVSAVADLPRRTVAEDEIRALRQGKTIEVGSIVPESSTGEVALLDAADALIGIARHEKGRLQPHIVFGQRG